MKFIAIVAMLCGCAVSLSESTTEQGFCIVEDQELLQCSPMAASQWRLSQDYPGAEQRPQTCMSIGGGAYACHVHIGFSPSLWAHFACDVVIHSNGWTTVSCEIEF